MSAGLENITCALGAHPPLKWQGRVVELKSTQLSVSGLSDIAHIGDSVEITAVDSSVIHGEVVGIEGQSVIVNPDGPTVGLRRGDQVRHLGTMRFAPNDSWIGRMVDPNGMPLDGRSLLNGTKSSKLVCKPPIAAQRRGLGPRLETGMALFDTILPIARGQRIGLFAGSGVGKTTLLGRLAMGIDADVIVVALVGERGRELNEFVDRVLGPEAMQRTIVVAATSDQSAILRRRCAWAGMAIAEHFRDEGKHVLLVLDSVTRFAEAHREVAMATGETSANRGFPASTMALLSGLCERAGTGTMNQGDITAIFSVLVSGSDMEEPLADMLRGVLDGHVVLERAIAEKGRFPAVNVSRSVSRCLPTVATDRENAAIGRARQFLTKFEQSEIMIRAGLYVTGNDPATDAAIKSMPELELFFSAPAYDGIFGSFQRLNKILDLQERENQEG